MPDPIRVGMIRCDTHGMWFGTQMMDHDSVLLERPVCFDDDRVARYSWMTRGVHYFFYTVYSRPRLMTAPRVEGFRIERLWDEDPEAAALAAKIFHGVPIVCDSFDQVSEDVDLVFISDCNGDGSDHLELARPGLERGVATFIDKPLAGNLEDALAINTLAAHHNAPLLSLSILQTNPATARFARRLDELGGVTFGTVTCASLHPAALIHAVSIVDHVFGGGVRSVAALRHGGHMSVHLDYGNTPNRPTQGVTIHVGLTDLRFTGMYAAAYGPEGMVTGRVLDDFNASEGSAVILQHLREMVRTRRPHQLHQRMIANVAVMDAIRRSATSGHDEPVHEVPA